MQHKNIKEPAHEGRFLFLTEVFIMYEKYVLPFIRIVGACRLAFQSCIFPVHKTVNVCDHERILELCKAVRFTAVPDQGSIIYGEMKQMGNNINEIRLLNADEIECRIAVINECPAFQSVVKSNQAYAAAFL